uniref:SDR family oxidoreductase n=1 Tax=Anaerolinea thermolimosa TaxID=229919 RepID=A0A7C4KHI3_9CHLR
MDESSDLTGKVILITGATDGIGKHTAENLARMGAHVVIIGRNAQKTESVVEAIRESSGNPSVDYLVGDLSAQREVRRLADEFRTRFGKLHVLINNAGALFMQRQLSPDGLEMTFALNHLAYFLLTLLLTDLLMASAPARVVNVSSAAHRNATLDLNDLQNEISYSGWKAYARSKLANLYFTYELARRLEGSRVTANALHPGFVATHFGRSNGGIFRPLFRLFQVAAISPEEGARTSVYLASSPEVEGVSGKYFERCKIVPSSPESYNAATARHLWDLSLQFVGLPAMMRIR